MKLRKKLENMFAASAFAEAGEFDTAREIAKEDTDDRRHEKAADEGRPVQHKEHTGMKPSSTSA